MENLLQLYILREVTMVALNSSVLVCQNNKLGLAYIYGNRHVFQKMAMLFLSI